MKITSRKATKKQVKLKMVVAGGPGAGKTTTALKVAEALVDPTLMSKSKILVLDTEKGASEKYAKQFDFEIVTPERYDPTHIKEYIQYAVDNGFDVLVIDTLSHYWNGEGGALEKVSGNFNNWKTVSPEIEQMFNAIMSAKIHIIVTLRLKMTHEVVENEKGKKEIKKMGLQAIFRDDTEYVFDLSLRMDQNNTGTIEKSRLGDYAPVGSIHHKPGAELAAKIHAWCNDGEEDRFVLPAEVSEKLKSVGASPLQINSVKSLDEARRLYQSLKEFKDKAAE